MYLEWALASSFEHVGSMAVSVCVVYLGFLLVSVVLESSEHVLSGTAVSVVCFGCSACSVFVGGVIGVSV